MAAIARDGARRAQEPPPVPPEAGPRPPSALGPRRPAMAAWSFRAVPTTTTGDGEARVFRFDGPRPLVEGGWLARRQGLPALGCGRSEGRRRVRRPPRAKVEGAAGERAGEPVAVGPKVGRAARRQERRARERAPGPALDGAAEGTATTSRNGSVALAGTATGSPGGRPSADRPWATAARCREVPDTTILPNARAGAGLPAPGGRRPARQRSLPAARDGCGEAAADARLAGRTRPGGEGRGCPWTGRDGHG